MLQSTSVAAVTVDRLQEVFGGGFIERLTSDKVRLIGGIILAVIVAYEVATVQTRFEGKTGEKFVAKLAFGLSILTAPGVFYLWWRAYSFVSGFWRDEELREPLFIGEPAPGSLWGVFTSLSLPWMLVTALLALGAFKVTTKDGLTTRILATLGVFAALLVPNVLFF